MNAERTFNRDDATLMVKLADQLSRGSDAEADVSDQLTELVAQATILPEGEQSSEHVELGAVVTYELIDKKNSQEVVTIVAPSDADPRASRFSVLTPVGLALIGVAVGAQTEVVLPSGRTQQVRVLAAHPDLLPAA